MTAYYNEFDPHAAAWLRQLIEDGLIAPGVVDERSIKDVNPSDLDGFTQCHFFAGIGGWSLALRMAGWPDDREVWTGSCPCQPFSNAGQRKGVEDERHLWPDFATLIFERRPAIVFGEQVASKDGRNWLSRVLSDLEALDFAVCAADLCAPGVGAPHIRQRLYWMADNNNKGLEKQRIEFARQERATIERSGAVSGVANAYGGLSGEERQQRSGEHRQQQEDDGLGRMVDAKSEQARFSRCPWIDREPVACIDGKSRPIEPGTWPLAHGIPERMVRIRGYGNAIVPQIAATFIEACEEALMLT